MVKKQKSPSLLRTLPLGTFGKLPIVISTKVNLLYLLYSKARRCFLLHLIKQNCFLKTFLRTLTVMTQVSFYRFSLLKLIWKCMIFLTPNMIKKLVMNVDFSKVFSPDCIAVGVLKNCKPELSYILAELFNECLKESCFPDCWKVS